MIYHLKKKYLRRLKTDPSLRVKVSDACEVNYETVNLWIRTHSNRLTNYTALACLCEALKISEHSELVTLHDDKGNEVDILSVNEALECKLKQLADVDARLKANSAVLEASILHK